MTIEPASTAPLQTHERWLYGGAGAIAPWLIALVTIDSVQVFRDLDAVVSVFWLAKSVGLFLIGGFVAFLHNRETDAWRCFVTGIAAPALITTALAGQAATRKAAFAPVIANEAYAASPMGEITEQAARVDVLAIGDVREGLLEKIWRGAFSHNPEMTWLIFAQERTQRDAQLVAATAASFISCARGRPRPSPTGGNVFGDRALVVSDGARGAYFAIVDVSDPFWRDINFASNRLTLYPQAVVSGPRSSFGPRLEQSLFQSPLLPVWSRIERQVEHPQGLCSLS